MACSLSQVTCPPFLQALPNAANTQHTKWTAFSISLWCTCTYLLAMLHLPFQFFKSLLLFSAASYWTLSAESEAQLFLFQPKKKKKNHTPWYHHIWVVKPFWFSTPSADDPSLSILLFCCHQLALPISPWILAMFPSILLAPPHACKHRFVSIYNRKHITMFHQNLAPQKSGIQFRWHQM